jgi:hypothetical protein
MSSKGEKRLGYSNERLGKMREGSTQGATNPCQKKYFIRIGLMALAQMTLHPFTSMSRMFFFISFFFFFDQTSMSRG